MAAAEMQVAVRRNHPGEGDDASAAASDAAAADNKLNYEIFSILESKFLFGYDDHQRLWQVPSPPPPPLPPPAGETTDKTQRGKVCVLCIDGGAGGVRGVLPGRALAYLESALQRASGDPDARVADFFDLAAGTGVGAVFSAMLFASSSSSSSADSPRPRFRADDTWRLVADHAARLFAKPRRAAPSLLGRKKRRPLGAATAALESAMKHAFGDALTLRDTLKPLLLSCFDLKTSAPFVFSRADAIESASFDFRLWEACCAAWAEPGRFEPAELRSVNSTTACVAVEGGLAMSNPAATAITHVLHNKHEFPFVRGVEDVLVLSIGCGGGTAQLPPAGDGELRQWGPKEWARPIARIAAYGAAELVDSAVAHAFGQWRDSNYVRIQAYATSSAGCGADGDYDPSPAGIRAVVAAADEMLKQRNVESVLFQGKRIAEQTNGDKIEAFAARLVAEHRSRGCRIAPTVAFREAPPRQAAVGR